MSLLPEAAPRAGSTPDGVGAWWEHNAHTRTAPDVVEKPLAAMRAGTSGAAEPWWPTAQDGKTPLPEAAPCAGPGAHGAADVVMEGEVFQTQLPGSRYWDLPSEQAASDDESSRQT